MLDQAKMGQEMFNMAKNYWTSTMEMMTNFQDQNEKMWNNLMEQGLVSQQEGRKMLQEWLTRAKQAREQFNKTMEDNWKKSESAFGNSPKSGK